MEADLILICVKRAEQLSCLCHICSPICRFYSSTLPNNHAGEQASESNESNLHLTFFPGRPQIFEIVQLFKIPADVSEQRNMQPQQISAIMKWV